MVLCHSNREVAETLSAIPWVISSLKRSWEKASNTLRRESSSGWAPCFREEVRESRLGHRPQPEVRKDLSSAGLSVRSSACKRTSCSLDSSWRDAGSAQSQSEQDKDAEDKIITRPHRILLFVSHCLFHPCTRHYY